MGGKRLNLLKASYLNFVEVGQMLGCFPGTLLCVGGMTQREQSNYKFHLSKWRNTVWLSPGGWVGKIRAERDTAEVRGKKGSLHPRQLRPFLQVCG